MTGFWRMMYGLIGMEYTSKNVPCQRQKHLKYLCNKELLQTDIQYLLLQISFRRRKYYLNNC